MKIFFAVLVGLCFVGKAQTNSFSPADSFRIWTLQKGGKFTAKAIEFKGTNEVVFAYTNGSHAATVITAFVDSDQNLLHEIRSRNEARIQTQRRKKAGRELVANGVVEFTTKEIKAYPEKFAGKRVWME